MPSKKIHIEQPLEIPVLPLRDVVVYPEMVIPLFVGRKKSIEALESAMEQNKEIFLVAQKVAKDEDPQPENLYTIGTVAVILQRLKLPDGTLKVLVEGQYRAQVKYTAQAEPYFTALMEPLAPVTQPIADAEALMRSLLAQFESYIGLNKKIPTELLEALNNIENTGRLVDTIAAHMPLKVAQKQQILETEDVAARLELLMVFIENEIEVLQVEGHVRRRVKQQMEKSQREYYLNAQMKAIQEELHADEPLNETEELEKRIQTAGMTKEAKEKALSELSKLKLMPPLSAEATVSRSFIEWLCNVPWDQSTKLDHDLAAAEEILDQDHYGLEKVKERVLEYLAVQQRVKKQKGAILCFVGPPGVGKTSLGQSIARATGREFVRMSLGGVHDEAEIRGHRRTYIGSMPGKILQKLAKAKVRNPLFLLDEIDKMSSDFRGDPAAALLEVLDPEQNNTFNDHYLEVDYDLSDVMFIATSNSDRIPLPLLDRMEVIHLSGYTEDEKTHIAIRYLIPKQMQSNGLKENELEINDQAVLEIIRYYTREAGVRGLEKELAKICRKVVRELGQADKKAAAEKKAATTKKTKAQQQIPGIKIDAANLEKYLGVKRYRYGLAEEADRVGQVCGLAWTGVGGELLTIEATAVRGKGKVSRTGKLGDVMQESIQAAMTVVRSRDLSLGIPADFYEKFDMHVHVPEGATPKDGPSAGIAMCTALVSALTHIPVRADVAMTGEITLRGEVLPIGGLKEKLLAAHRGGIKTVIIPHDNVRDLKDIPANIQTHLTIKPVRWIDEVLDIALSQKPVPLLAEAPTAIIKKTKTRRGVVEDDRVSKH